MKQEYPSFFHNTSQTVKNVILILLLALTGQMLFAQNSVQRARQLLQERAGEFGLLPADMENLELSDEVASKRSGLTHYYFRQTVNGIGIYQANAQVSLNASGTAISMWNRALVSPLESANGAEPSLSPLQALNQVIKVKNWPAAEGVILESSSPGLQQKQQFSGGNISLEPIPFQLMYVPKGNSLRLAWDCSVLETDESHWWSLKIDAETGEILNELDWMVSCNWDHPAGVHAHAHPKALLPSPGIEQAAAAPNSYVVYAEPVESPNHGNRSSITAPWVTAASPFGWHDTDGANGAEFTITRGNNVWAQEDQNGNNGTGFSPDGGATLDFNFPINLGNQPNTYASAAITNLFYWNNLMHDVWYVYGFDENGGSFQQNNYGKGGLGNDYVFADAQDGSGLNNANFGTPPDGNRPRMQMFLWAGQSTTDFVVNSPAGIAGSYNAVSAAFGGALSPTPLTGNLVLANDGSGNPSEACNPITNGAAISGNIALIDRGNCTFVSKVANAQNVGATACVVCNNVGGGPFAMGGNDPSITIPAVMISQADCNIIKAQLASGVNISLSGTGGNVDRDGDLDNLIIAHEYGHGISNRLTGGPSNANCLGNSEQMGEGWSDWFGLMLTMTASDLGTDRRGVGTYAIFQPTNGTGIRPAPYSTDMSINGFTYGDISAGGISQPHGIGFLWANMLWEMTWLLVDQYGFDADYVNGTGGNNVAMALVTEGMKLQPCSPGFVDGRDAILAADQALFAGANQCLIWQAFAKRGLGFSASQGSSGSRSDGSEAFDVPALCSVLPVHWASLEAIPQTTAIQLSGVLQAGPGMKSLTLERRSSSETGFADLAKITANPDRNGQQVLSYPDRQVQPGQTYYYRLRAIDQDGALSYSPIVHARLDAANKWSLTLFPNPVQDQVQISLSGSEIGTARYSLESLLGRTLREGELGSGNTSLDLSTLPAGTYLFRLNVDGESMVKKIVKE